MNCQTDLIHPSIANPSYVLKSAKNIEWSIPTSSCAYSIVYFSNLEVGNCKVYVLTMIANALIPCSTSKAYNPKPLM